MGKKYKPYVYFINWLGFKRANIEMKHALRFESESSYSFKKLIYFVAANIISQLNKPLKMSIKLSFTMLFFFQQVMLYI